MNTGEGLRAELRRFQCAEALLLALPVALVLILINNWILRIHPDLAPVAVLALGFIPFHVGAAGTVVLVFARAHPRGRRLEALQLERIIAGFGQAIRLAARSLVWIYPLTWVLTGLTVLLFWLAGYKPAEPLILQWFAQESDPGAIGLMLAGVLLLAPVAEEVLFRLVLYDALSLLNARVALVATALGFALIHGIPEQVPGLVALGLALQHLRQRTGSLWPPIFLHALYNLISLFLAFMYLHFS